MEKKERKKLSLKDFGTEKIIFIALAGILLLVINVSEWKSRITKTSEKAKENVVESDGNEAYIERMENKLVQILQNVDGVGKVEVMLTLKASKEAILNKDTKSEAETEEETGKDSEKRRQSAQKEEETILADEEGADAPYVIKEMEPEIAGVIISCEGADDNVVTSSVVEAAQVLFGISASHIKVLKMEVSK